ncbi:pyrroline-5-carboxylate reductase [Auriscalpium vulgare]|uniref:Pyrroline-5-carboxylate reductase n=1 Tax=Auriscalpium vulgare TaxID=40419 RepID=A0ACB8RRT5_9AGAM|nr:pyrroline-5-carboxylate reductase [Auriscalpium vulgare]
MGYTLCVLGCGTMGIAITSGVLASLQAPVLGQPAEKWEYHTPGTMTPDPAASSLPTRFLACVSRSASAQALAHVFAPGAVEISLGENVRAVQQADVVLLCCKPQLAHVILAEEGMQEALDGKLVISILAGVTIAQLTAWVPASARVIRAMPNTPCRIREGMTVVSTLPPSATAARDRSIVLQIFSSIGRVRILDEKHFDACTALSGSGPAFACIFLEAMADGGVMMGLPRAEALELAAQTLQGAARMALQPGAHPAQIKDSVTTPGGCTIAGLLALEDGRVRSTIARAIQVATERASELGQPAKK